MLPNFTFNTLKIAKLNKNIFLETIRNKKLFFREYHKVAPRRVNLEEFLIFPAVFKIKLHFFSIFNAIFDLVKMNFGSKFRAWITFHAAILKFLKVPRKSKVQG